MIYWDITKSIHPIILADKAYFKSLGFKLVKGKWL